MNFHKTIGFLATLLLTLGIGVPDSFAQTPTVDSVTLTITTPDPATILDTADRTLVTLSANVSLSAALAAEAEAMTVTLTLVDSTATSVKPAANRAEASDYTLSPDIFGTTIDVIVAPGSDSGTAAMTTFLIDPNTDIDDMHENLAIGAAVGDEGDAVTIQITDTDNPVESVTLTITTPDPATILDTADRTTITLSANVSMRSAVTEAMTVTLTLVDSTATSVKPANTRAEASDYTISPDIFGTTIDVILADTESEAATAVTTTFLIDPHTDTDTMHDHLAIGAGIGSVGDAVTIQITDTDNPVESVTLTITTPDPATILDTADRTAVTMTANVSMRSAVTEAMTVTLTLVDSTATSVKPAANRAEASDYTLSPDIFETTVDVILAETESEAATAVPILFFFDPNTDTDTMHDHLAIGAGIGSVGDAVTIQITDTDNPVTEVSLQITVPDADSDTATEEFDDTAPRTLVTLSANVTMRNALAADAEAMTVTLTLVDSTATSVKPAADRAVASDYTLSPDIFGTTIDVIVAPGSDSGTAVTETVFFEPNVDSDNKDETLAIGAGVGRVGDAVTIVIDDTQEETGEITSVELSPAALSVNEGETLTATVTVKVNAVAGTAQTVDVTLSVDSGDLAALGITSATVPVTIDNRKTSGMAMVPIEYMAPEDDTNTIDEMITITGMAGTVGGDDNTSTITAMDNDEAMVTSVALSPATLSVAEGVTLATTVTVTVNMDLSRDVESQQDVTLSVDSGDLAALGIASATVPVTIPADQTSGMAMVPIEYMAPEDDNSVSEMITITGMVGMVGGDANTTTITAMDNETLALASVELSLAPVAGGTLDDTAGNTAFRLTANVNMTGPAAAAADHVITLSLDDTHMSDFTLANLGITQLTVNVAAGASAGTAVTHDFLYDPQEDADATDEVIAIKGMSGGMEAVGSFTITDTDIGVAGVTLTLTRADGSTAQLSDTAGPTTLRLTANVTADEMAPAGGLDFVVDLSLADTHMSGLTLADLGITNNQLTVNVAAGMTAGTAMTKDFVFDPQEDADAADEVIAIKGMSGGMEAVGSLTIKDTGAAAAGAVASVGLSPAMLSVDEGSSLADGTMITVTVNVAAGAATSHSVDLTAMGADLMDLGLPASVMVDVMQNATSGTAMVPIEYMAAEDDDNTVSEMITITGMVGTVGGTANTVTITAVDNDMSSVTSVVLSADPEMLSAMEEGTPLSTTVTVTVLVDLAPAADATHDVVLTSMGATLAELGVTSPVSVMVNAGDKTGTAAVPVTITGVADADTDDETITLTGTYGTFTSTVTFTVVDDDKGAVSSVALSPSMLSATEGMPLATTVTVTVTVAAGSGGTYNVNLSSSLPTGSIATPVAVSVAKDATTGMAEVALNYTPPQDDNTTDEMITITGMVGTVGSDDGSNVVTITVADDDMGAVTGLMLSPATIPLTEGVAFSGMVTVTVNVEAGAASTHSVALSSSLPTGSIATPVVVSVDQGATSGMAEVALNYTPPTDADVDDEEIVITGTLGDKMATVTLNVTDNTASKGTVKVTTSMESIRENSRTRSVVVTATLPAAPGAGNTVTVNVVVTGGTADEPATITIADANTSGTATVRITPVNDAVFTTSAFTVTGGATGYKSGTAMIDIIDDDASLGTLSITSAPPSATLSGGAQDLTLTVTLWLATPDTPIPPSLVVNVATDKGTLASNTVTITNTRKHPDHDPATRRADGNAKVVLSLAAGDVSAAGNITVTASADMYETGTREIPIRARGALDIAGYRAVIVTPTGTNWANVGNDKVKVDVTRYGDVAYPWTDFESIKVSVRDTAHAAFELEQVTASGFNREDGGSVTFLEPASPSRGDVIWRGNDTIRFEIRIRGYSASRDPADNGQYLGAYAHVEFKSGQDTDAIETRDDETSVYAANPSLVDDAKVGDGRLIRIDNQVPAHSGVADIVVTSGDEVGSDIDATVGDEIRVAVALSQTNLFRETGLRIQLQIVDGSGSVNGQTLTAAQRNAPSKNKDFTTSQVIAAANDSLIHTYKVTEGFFTITLDDFVEGVGAKGSKVDLNNAQARVRAGVRDQAANFKWFGWTTFDIDSRLPSVSILYPSADPDSIYAHTHPLRFTGNVEDIEQGQNVDAHLNPLAILVDEDLSKLEVFAVGADTLNITGQMPSDAIGDSMAVYDTSDLSSPKKDGEGDDDKYPGAFVPSSANRAGTAIDLVVLATDELGNVNSAKISGVTHDASPPEITEWFPKNRLLPEDQINDETPPIFTVPEDVDSIAVTFEGSNGSDVTKQRGEAAKGEHSIDFSGALVDEVLYDMTIFARDLAGNVFITPADSSASMRFNAQFDNPVANRYNISTGTDSVIAGQANILTIQAEDHDAGSDTARNALTYKNAARISAWDASGGAAESVWFVGAGVTDDADNPDGVAMLNAADWSIGKRTVEVKSNKAVGSIKILVQHMSAGVVGFESAKEGLYVGAADFAAFEITAWEEGVEGAAEEIWGDYTLRVVPTDRHGNPSVRAFKADPAGDDADSLDVLDTRAGDNAFEYKDGIDVEIVGVPTIEDFALLILSVEKEGASYDLVAPADRRSQTVQVRVVNGSLKEGDTRSQNVRSSARFVISEPLTPVLTVWVEGMEGDQAGNDVVVPATVTVAAEGYNAGDMVTFTQNGQTVGTLRANDEGVAKAPPITVNMAGMAVVSATNGRYATDALTITFVDAPAEPARKSYADANGDPVYLIYTGDAAPDMTVGVNDFLALVAAFMSSMGDDNYNALADVNDDGTVDVADFLEFLTSWGRTAAGPATKPLVLLPGINENAEFSLSLGSERVIAGELVVVDVSLANVAALVGYGFALNYETDKFEFVSVAPADEDLLKSTGGETLFHHVVADGQVTVANGLFNGTAVSGGGDVVQFVFRVLREFEDNARFEVADGLVFDPGQLSNPAVVAGVLELQSTPREFALHQNFPNPFNPDTTIKYDLAESADVTLQIYNVLGQVIRTLVASEAQNAGRYQIRWNGMDDRGVPVSSGIYFYQISADGKFSDVRKLMLLK